MIGDGIAIAVRAMVNKCEVCRARVEGIDHRPWHTTGRWAIGRKGGAKAVTIHEHIRGFRGWRAPWWKREAEVPFPDWQTEGLWLNRARAKAKREASKVSSAATSSPTTQRELFG